MRPGIQHWIWVVALGCVCMLLLSDMALAQTVSDYSVNRDFRCVNGSAAGDLLIGIGNCGEGPGNGRVFSYFICQFEQTLSEVLGDVYCAVVDEAEATIIVTLTLLVTITGISFLVGMTPFTAKELIMLAGKFSLVLAFATQAEYMIGYGYALFMAAAKEGIIMVLGHLFETGYTSGNDVYRLFDDYLSEMLSYASGDAGSAAAGSEEACQNALFAMVVVVAAAMPLMAGMVLYFFVKFLWVILRAVFGYCQGILGLTFLIVLSPIYVSFALFAPTRSLFDKYVQYLISFSFQMVIVFAFLGMMFHIIGQMGDTMEDYQKLIVPTAPEAAPAAGFLLYFPACGICELQEMRNVGDVPQCKLPKKEVPLMEMMKNDIFLKTAGYKIFALMLMFYILEVLMSFIPQMALYLAGPKYAGQLGGGGNINMPGEQAVSNALTKGMSEGIRAQSTPQGVVAGIGKVIDEGIFGQQGFIAGTIRGAVNPQDPFRIDDPNKVDRDGIGSILGAAALGTAGMAGLQAMMGPDAVSLQAKSSIENSLARLEANPSVEAVQQAIDSARGSINNDQLAKIIQQLRAENRLPQDVLDKLTI